MLICIPAWPGSVGCPSTGFSSATRSAAEGAMRSRSSCHKSWRWRLGLARPPMPLAVKRVMHIGRGVKVGMGLVVTHGTPEQLAPFLDDALAIVVGEPLPLGARAASSIGMSHVD